jgi:excisionase family DNA binding protein
VGPKRKYSSIVARGLKTARQLLFRSVDEIATRIAKDHMIDSTEPAFKFSQSELPAEPIWDSTTAARYLRIHPRTLTRMARQGAVPCIQIGRLWRFRRLDLDDWLNSKVSSVSYPCRLNS